jgi:hypothetical protein
MECKHCKAQMPDGAKFCLACRNHQSWSKNLLPFIGGMIALITLIASTMLYIVDKSQILFHNWKDQIKVISLVADADGLGGLSVVNTGDGKIYLDAMQLRCEQCQFLTVISINRELNSGDFLSINSSPNTYKADINCNSILSMEDVNSEAIIRNVGQKDVYYYIYNTDNFSLKSIVATAKKCGKTACQIPAEAEFTFYSSHQGIKLTQKVNCFLLVIKPSK